MITNVSGGIGILQSTTVNSVDVLFRDVLIIGPTSGLQCTAGVQILNCGDVTLDHVSTVHTGIGLDVSPQSTKNIQAIFVTNSFFDSGQGYGIQIQPAAGGIVNLIKISDTWSATNSGHGIGINSAGLGVIQRVELVNVTSSNNGLDGINVGTGSSISIIGGSMSANRNGIYIGPGTVGLQISEVTAGPSGEFPGGNRQYGLILASGATNNYQIIGNNLTGNMIDNFVNYATGNNYRIYGNLGTSYVQSVSGVTWTIGTGSPEGVVTAPVGSMYTRTNGAANTTLYIKETGTGNTGWTAK
jgi:hypothetical protein